MSGINLRTREGWDELKRILDDRPDDVLAMCGLVAPATSRSQFFVLDPMGGDSKPDSFSIWLKPDGLSWKRYNGSEQGRSLELIAYSKGWYHLKNRGADEAARFAIDHLRLGSVSPAELERDRAAAAERRQRLEQDRDAERERKAKAAFATFAGAVPILGHAGAGTLAENYLRVSRGIDLRADPFVGPRGGRLAPGSLRFSAAEKYIIRNADQAPCGESFHPCMIACCVDAAGKIRALHKTWLNHDGTDKAHIRLADDGTPQKARKVLGEARGCVIPLWRGEGHFSTQDAAAAGLLQTLVLCEGVEDGLSAVLAVPQHRVWAAISLSNIANVAQRLPACCDTVIVHQQNDWAKPSAVKAFDQAIAALRATGRTVSVVAAAIGKDLNDTLRGAA